MVKNKKILTEFCLVILIILISGCGSDLGVSNVEVYSGTRGLSMEALDGLPPEEMYVGTEQNPGYFQVGVDLKNEGAYDITDGIISVSYDPKFNVYSDADFPRRKFNLYGRSDYYPEGEMDREIFTFKNIGLPTNSVSAFAVTACYRYETVASVDVCVSPYYKPLAKVSDDICDPKDYTDIRVSGGQGAPLAVTNVKESIRPRGDNLVDIVFGINIQNMGGGEVRSYETYSKECEGNSAIDIKDIKSVKIKEVKFSDYTLSNGKIQCEIDNSKTLEKTVICSTTIDKNVVRSSYVTPLQIIFDYGYVERIFPSIKFNERSEI